MLQGFHTPHAGEMHFLTLVKSVGCRLQLYLAEQPRRDAALPAEEPTLLPTDQLFLLF